MTNYYLVASKEKIDPEILGGLAGKTGFFRPTHLNPIVDEIIKEALAENRRGFRGQIAGRDFWTHKDEGLPGGPGGTAQQQEIQAQEEPQVRELHPGTAQEHYHHTVTEEKIGEEKTVMVTTIFPSNDLFTHPLGGVRPMGAT